MLRVDRLAGFTTRPHSMPVNISCQLQVDPCCVGILASCSHAVESMNASFERQLSVTA